jgi:tripartite-type tricarboxylate transporter receptor subunit TctC
MQGELPFGRFVVLVLLGCAGTASAQDYPTKPVRIVIGFPPGGPNELTARPVAQKLQELLGQPFILDHRPGANSIIAIELVAKSPPAAKNCRACACIGARLARSQAPFSLRGEDGNSRTMVRAVRTASACMPMRALQGKGRG